MSLVVLLLTACDRDQSDFMIPPSDVPAVKDLGVAEMVSPEDMLANDNVLTGLPQLKYESLGAPDPTVDGGATLQFMGTGGPVCIFADPEAVFWNQDITEDGGTYNYEDRFTDDGDIDIYAGLSAYYTGSPGFSIGTFELPYTDPLGESHTIDFEECSIGFFHAGRATNEYCEIDTTNRGGIAFTVLLKSFAMPVDDGILNFGVAVINGPCDGFRKSECVISNESGLGEETDVTGLEAAFCAGDLDEYCAAHLNDENPPCQKGYHPQY